MTMTAAISTAEAVSTRKRGWLRRIVMGGSLSDLGRLPRYVAFALLGGALIWAPIMGYLKSAPLTYKSHTSLILPGSGASASMNLNGIGQASSYANSAFASNAVSPTETYKRLLNADRIIDAAAASLEIDRAELGRPRVNLVDQTSLIHFEITGGSPIEAQRRGEAVLAAFNAELDALRADEQKTRQDSSIGAIQDYRDSVAQTRVEIDQLQAETGLFSVGQYEELLGQHTQLSATLGDQQVAVRELAAELRVLEGNLGLTAETAALTIKLFADEEYRSLLSQIAEHAARLSDRMAQYGANHPLVEDSLRVKAQAEDAAAARAWVLTGLTRTTLASLDFAPDGQRAALLAELVATNATYIGASERLQGLQSQYAEDGAELAQLAQSAARLQDLQRDFSVAEAIFASAIARSETTKADVYASYPLVQVLENPSLPDRPSSPNRKLAFAAGLAGTMMMLMGLFLAWSRMFIISLVIRKVTTAS